MKKIMHNKKFKSREKNIITDGTIAAILNFVL